MIHEAQCTIIIDPVKLGPGVNIMGIGAEPPIPTDAEIEEVFPEWKSKGRIFIARAVKEEGKDGHDVLTQQDLFRYGMKYVICEAKKLAG
jgi:hypothetical protein